MSHLSYALLMALLVSGAAAGLGNRGSRDTIYVAAYTFLTCLVSIFAGGWLMHLIHG